MAATDAQVRKLMEELSKHGKLGLAAARSPPRHRDLGRLDATAPLGAPLSGVVTGAERMTRVRLSGDFGDWDPSYKEKFQRPPDSWRFRRLIQSD